jgi:hypothetical protein
MIVNCAQIVAKSKLYQNSNSYEMRSLAKFKLYQNSNSYEIRSLAKFKLYQNSNSYEIRSLAKSKLYQTQQQQQKQKHIRHTKSKWGWHHQFGGSTIHRQHMHWLKPLGLHFVFENISVY